MKRICFVVDSIFSIGGVQRVTAVIAKELAKDYDVSIVTFDKLEQKDTNLYGLKEVDIAYRFFSYPKIGNLKKYLCKAYSGLYLKLQPQCKWCSDLYAHSSYPSELRNALLAELKQGNYDVIFGVHAPLAARLATIKRHLPGVKCIGWLHNSYEALFGEDSHFYIGAKRRRHYIYQFRKLDDVVLLCNHDAKSYYDYDPQFKPTVIYNPLTLKPGEISKGTSKRFLAIGRFSHKHKGFDLLIKAFNIFAKNNKDWHLDIVGEGPEEELYKELDDVLVQLEDLVYRINITNVQIVQEGDSLTRLIAKRDVLSMRVKALKEVVNYVAANDTRFGRNELKYVRTIDIKSLRKEADTYAKQYRELDLKIQSLNWTVDLADLQDLPR